MSALSLHCPSASTRCGAAICLQLAGKAGAGAESLPPKRLLGVERRPEPRRQRRATGTTPAWPPPPACALPRSGFHSRGEGACRGPGTWLPRCGSRPASWAAQAAGSGSSGWRRPRIPEPRGVRAMEHVTEGSWETLPVPLHPRVLGVLRDLGFPYMTPVQVPGAARGTRGRRAQGADGERHPPNGARPVGLSVSTRYQEFSAFQRGLVPRLQAARTRAMPSV